MFHARTRAGFIAALLALLPFATASASSVVIDFNQPVTDLSGVGSSCRAPASGAALPICSNWSNFDASGFRFSPISLWLIDEPKNNFADFQGTNYLYWGDTGGHNPDYLGPTAQGLFPIYVDFYGKSFSLESLWLVDNCDLFVTSSAGGDTRGNAGGCNIGANGQPGGLQRGLNLFTGAQWTDLTYLILWGSSPASGQRIDNVTFNTVAEPSITWLLVLALPLLASLRHRRRSFPALRISDETRRAA